MKTVKMFISEKCPGCPGAQRLGARLKSEGFDVHAYDVGTVDGLAEAALNRVFATPSILIVDAESETLMHEWRGTTPGADEVLHALR